MPFHIAAETKSLLLLSFLTLFPGIPGFAQKPYPDTIDLYPATIIAIRPGTEQKEALELDYRDNMAHDGGALLNQLASISSIRKSGSYGFDPVFRGFKYEQLNLVINGAQTASAACPNRMDPPSSQISPNMIQRIEVLKGPHALRYGNAFGGTINFQSAPPRFSEDKSAFGRLSGQYSSNGGVMRTEGLVGFTSEKLNFGLYGAWTRGNDYWAADRTEIPARFMRASLGARMSLKITPGQLLKLSATRNIARDADFAALPMDLREDDTWLLSATHEIYPSATRLKSWKSTVYGSFVDHLMDNLLKSLDPRPVNAVTRANTLNYGFRSEGSWTFGQTRLYTGLDYRFEGADGLRTREFLLGPNAGNTILDNVWQGATLQKAGLFAEYQVQGAVIKWVVSGRLNYNQARITDPDPNFDALYEESRTSQFNPAISLGTSRRITEKLTLGLWLGHVQRSGSVTERYINYFPVGVDPYEMVGNPMLDPEINNEVDLNIKWTSINTAVQLDVFMAYLRDPISSIIDDSLDPRMPSSPGVRRYINLQQAIKTGFEASWSQVLVAGLRHEVSLAYTHGKDLKNNDPLPEIAPLDLRIHLYGNYLSRRLIPYLKFRYVMEQSRISREFGETETPSFTLFDLGLSFNLSMDFRISAGIQNLFNALYYEHLNRSVRGASALPIYAPGRCFFLSFNLDLT
jgi:iron complex outermembrane receptor protein